MVTEKKTVNSIDSVLVIEWPAVFTVRNRQIQDKDIDRMYERKTEKLRTKVRIKKEIAELGDDLSDETVNKRNKLRGVLIRAINRMDMGELAKYHGIELQHKLTKFRVFTRCIDCPNRDICPRAFEETYVKRKIAIRTLKDGNPFNESEKRLNKEKNLRDEDAKCMYEVEARDLIKRGRFFSAKAFVSKEPTDLLAKMFIEYQKLEDIANADPDWQKQTKLYKMLYELYKARFPNTNTAIQINNENTQNNGTMTLDIKQAMKKVREQKEDDNIILTNIQKGFSNEDDKDDD